MIRVVSWNIDRKHAAWRELAQMDADIALVQEGGQPPDDVSSVLKVFAILPFRW